MEQNRYSLDFEAFLRIRVKQIFAISESCFHPDERFLAFNRGVNRKVNPKVLYLHKRELEADPFEHDFCKPTRGPDEGADPQHQEVSESSLCASLRK